MASLGYVVIAIDSRGSANRGLEFESAIKDRLGHVEITDQIEGLEWLASQVDYIGNVYCFTNYNPHPINITK